MGDIMGYTTGMGNPGNPEISASRALSAEKSGLQSHRELSHIHQSRGLPLPGEPVALTQIARPPREPTLTATRHDRGSLSEGARGMNGSGVGRKGEGGGKGRLKSNWKHIF